ncbi:MAG: GDP-mannose 4,6-dehydratase [Actinobacteria bacterium]|nr:GDP-mannose 4,6-dehydratase [Actinomycetota bacterium]
MSIVVTGGAGFIGSSLCERLINLNQDIICIDNFNNFYNPLIKENNISNLINNKNFKLYKIDICDINSLRKIFNENKIELVIHLAAMAGVRPSIVNPLIYEKVNIEGTLNILNCLKENNIKKLIFASSSSVYGGNKKIPFSEEDKVDNPISPYAATKKAGELICYTYHHLYDISVYCFRFFTVYGPRQRPEMAIFKFTKKIFNEQEISIYGDGSSSRDYTYIDDIINGIINSIQNIKGYEIINLGNSHPTTLKELIKIIEEASGKYAKIKFEEMKPGDVFTTFADIKKAIKMINYNPQTSIYDGINKFISWFKQIREDGKLYE